jgi:hypothetical protein
MGNGHIGFFWRWDIEIGLAYRRFFLRGNLLPRCVASAGMVLGGRAAVTSAIILVSLVAAIAGVLTIAFAAGCFIPMMNSRK